MRGGYKGSRVAYGIKKTAASQLSGILLFQQTRNQGQLNKPNEPNELNKPNEPNELNEPNEPHT
jgi:hypothetical protein